MKQIPKYGRLSNLDFTPFAWRIIESLWGGAVIKPAFEESEQLV
jgi:hypothetical protein